MRLPRLHVGARTDGQLRGTVVITSWTDAGISWPRCLPVNSKGHPSLLLDDELARAVRTEAAAAVQYHWGVNNGVVQRWRKFLDVTRTSNARAHQLMLDACQTGADALKAKEWTDQELQAKRELAKVLNLARHLRPRYRGDEWTEAEIKLLGFQCRPVRLHVRGKKPTELVIAAGGIILGVCWLALAVLKLM